MYKFLEDQKFLEARSKRQHYFFGKVLPGTPSWDDVFRNLEKSMEEESLIKLGPYLSIVTHDGDKHIRLAGEFLAELGRLDPALKGSAHVYIGLTKFSESFGKHKDNSDVWSWQVIGATRWKVFAQGGVMEYTLNAGDVLYVPRNMEHEVTSLCPRVGISFGLDYGTAQPAA